MSSGESTQAPSTGPRGGKTTVTKSGLVKKNLWIPGEDAARLRRVAFESHVSEAEVMRQGLRLALERWEESNEHDSPGGQDD